MAMRTGAVDPVAVVVIAVPVMIVVGALSWWWRGRLGVRRADAWIDGALAGTLVGVLLATFTPLSAFGTTAPYPRAIQLVPLERLDGAPVEFAVINLLLLAPVAFLLVLRGTRARFVQVVLACAALSVTIETLQLFHPDRGTNVDDVLLNSVGALAGAVLGGVARLVRPTTREDRAARRRGRRRQVSRPSPTGS
jgi:glycopeptide antibiotics resistance protein